jgi:DNA segregation ATPase FtsK/SpoIIIE-like protein
MTVDQAAAADPLLTQARELLLVHQNPSVAFMQRHLKIGYSRALELMQSLEGDVVTAPNADGWRRMLHSGNLSPQDPQSPDYKPED